MTQNYLVMYVIESNEEEKPEIDYPNAFVYMSR
jgi:hypothetical protein